MQRHFAAGLWSWRRLEDSNPHALADNGFLDRCNSHSASSRRMLVGRAGFEPAAFPMSLIYSQFPSPVWIPTHVRFPLRLSRRTSDAGAVSCSYPRWDLHPVWLFSAGLVFLCEDLRYAHIIRERPGLWWQAPGIAREQHRLPYLTESAALPAAFLLLARH